MHIHTQAVPSVIAAKAAVVETCIAEMGFDLNSSSTAMSKAQFVECREYCYYLERFSVVLQEKWPLGTLPYSYPVTMISLP